MRRQSPSYVFLNLVCVLSYLFVKFFSPPFTSSNPFHLRDIFAFPVVKWIKSNYFVSNEVSNKYVLLLTNILSEYVKIVDDLRIATKRIFSKIYSVRLDNVVEKGLEILTLKVHLDENRNRNKQNLNKWMEYQLIIKRVVNDQKLLKATLN